MYNILSVLTLRSQLHGLYMRHNNNEQLFYEKFFRNYLENVVMNLKSVMEKYKLIIGYQFDERDRELLVAFWNNNNSRNERDSDCQSCGSHTLDKYILCAELNLEKFVKLKEDIDAIINSNKIVEDIKEVEVIERLSLKKDKEELVEDKQETIEDYIEKIVVKKNGKNKGRA